MLHLSVSNLIIRYALSFTYGFIPLYTYQFKIEHCVVSSDFITLAGITGVQSTVHNCH